MLACVLASDLACDLGDLDFDPTQTEDARLPVSHEGRRVLLGTDGPYEICAGNLAAWSAQVDAVDAALGIRDNDDAVHLFLYGDALALEEACENSTGCYHDRPPGPEALERLEELGPAPIYWFPFERLETQWSADLPEFVRHGTAAALTDRSCGHEFYSLESVLLHTDAAGLDLGRARATGHFFRHLLEEFGAEAFRTFATKLEGASSPAYVRAVFTEVYGRSMESSWESVWSLPQPAPPGGWCGAPMAPWLSALDDPSGSPGRWSLTGQLDCRDPTSQVAYSGDLERRVQIHVDAPLELEVSGELGAGVQLTIEACSCGVSGATVLTPGDRYPLEPGSYRVRLVASRLLWVDPERMPEPAPAPDAEDLAYALELWAHPSDG